MDGAHGALRVIVFMNSFFELSGGDVRCIELTRAFVARGYKVTVITSAPGMKLFEDYGLRNLNFVLTAGKESARSTLQVSIHYARRTILALVLLIRSYLRDNSGKLVLFSSSDFLPDVLPAYVLKLLSPSSIWLASVYHLIPNPDERNAGSSFSFFGQRISFVLIRKSDIVQTETEFMKDWLKQNLRLAGNAVIVVSSGMNNFAADRIESKERVYEACFLARLSPTKGLDDVVKAWKLVCEKHTTARLAIAGAGSEESLAHLRRLVGELGLAGNVIIIGRVSEEDKYSLLKSSKIYVLPSYEEGVPITFFEALYCSTPVVTYYLPTYNALREVLVTVEKGDIKGLADTLGRLLEDESVLQKYKQMGKERAVNNSWENVAAEVISKLEGKVQRMG